MVGRGGNSERANSFESKRSNASTKTSPHVRSLSPWTSTKAVLQTRHHYVSDILPCKNKQGSASHKTTLRSRSLFLKCNHSSALNKTTLRVESLPAWKPPMQFFIQDNFVFQISPINQQQCFEHRITTCQISSHLKATKAVLLTNDAACHIYFHSTTTKAVLRREITPRV